MTDHPGTWTQQLMVVQIRRRSIINQIDDPELELLESFNFNVSLR